ncbi:MAG: preprotein translocase subunit SecA [Proteobacteria bacterium]|nr:preprotein translocase subunit SecA [Pseudomonadota bacterium]
MQFLNSHLAKDKNQQLQADMIKNYSTVVQEINDLIAYAAELVSQLPSDQLLLCTSQEFIQNFNGVVAETEIGVRQGSSKFLLEYIQSLVASVPSHQNQRDKITKKEWVDLKETIEKLFNKLMVEYQQCLTAKRLSENPTLDMYLEEFRVRAEWYWCFVRGKRYHVHERQSLLDIITPHSAIIKELFGITANQLVEELCKVQDSLIFGYKNSLISFNKFRENTLNSMNRGGVPISKIMENSSLMKQGQEAFGKLFGLDRFDLEKITNLPKLLLDKLSWEKGQDKDFFAEGEFKGWPLRIWPTFKRPFLKLNNKYYCFDHTSLFDKIYRVLEQNIKNLKPEYKETWNIIQKDISEQLPLTYLNNLMPGAKVFRDVYYPIRINSKTEWCEVDGLVAFEDHLFILEARAGAFTYTTPATDLNAQIESLKNLILKPSEQGKRFVKYLKGSDESKLYSKDHKHISTISHNSYRHITICAITLDSFTELAAKAQHMRQINIEVNNPLLWVFSIDDLRVYADIFYNPLIFLHFVEQRMRAANSLEIKLDDELDHLGLYFQHNNYALYAKQQREKHPYSKINFSGYRDPIDSYFFVKLSGDETLPRPEQNFPKRFAELINFLKNSSYFKRAKIVSFLLDMDRSLREALSNKINQQIEDVSFNRSYSFSIYSDDVRITVFCWTEDFPKSNTQTNSLDHTKAVMFLRGESNRIMLELTYDKDLNLKSFIWHHVKLDNLSSAEIKELQYNSALLRKDRLKRIKGKIGRNDYCPCYSGKKYKKCCGK